MSTLFPGNKCSKCKSLKDYHKICQICGYEEPYEWESIQEWKSKMQITETFCPSCCYKTEDCDWLKCVIRRDGQKQRYPYDKYNYQFPSAFGQVFKPNLSLNLTDIEIIYLEDTPQFKLQSLANCTKLIKLSIHHSQIPHISFKRLKILEITGISDKRGDKMKAFLKLTHDIEHLSLIFNNKSYKIFDLLAKCKWITSLSIDYTRCDVGVLAGSIIGFLKKHNTLTSLKLSRFPGYDDAILKAISNSNLTHFRMNCDKCNPFEIMQLLGSNKSLIYISLSGNDCGGITVKDNKVLLPWLQRNRKIYMHKFLVDVVLSLYNFIDPDYCIDICSWLFCDMIDVDNRMLAYIDGYVRQIYCSIFKLPSKAIIND